jgi:hypothetical protein
MVFASLIPPVDILYNEHVALTPDGYTMRPKVAMPASSAYASSLLSIVLASIRRPLLYLLVTRRPIFAPGRIVFALPPLSLSKCRKNWSTSALDSIPVADRFATAR